MAAHQPLSVPVRSNHPVDVGLRTEAAITSELVRRGYRVLLPVSSNQRYDLVIDLNGEFVRAQCKTGRFRGGVVRFSTQSVRSSMTKVEVRQYKGEADLFLVYCEELKRTYAVPVDEAPRREMCLRVLPCRQTNGVNLASDYELPA